jgi:hypothetical protein
LLDSFELKKYLKDLGFKHVKDNVQIDGFSHSNLEFPVYLKTTENKRLKPSTESPIVFHVEYEEKIRQFLLKNTRVSAGTDFYAFNSNMSGFEKKLNKGKKEEAFGIHLDVADKEALDQLFHTLSHSQNDSSSNETEISDDLSNSKVDENVLQSIKTRRGQPAFRKALLEAFGRTCCITGCKVEEVLEAAHIVPHGEETNYSVFNGLLLRADIHTLFDLGLLNITVSGLVQLDESLKESDYQRYEGLELMNGELPIQMVDNLRELADIRAQ